MTFVSLGKKDLWEQKADPGVGGHTQNTETPRPDHVSKSRMLCSDKAMLRAAG